MKITFIKPNIGRKEHSLFIDEARMEPLQLGVLAGMTPPEVECRIFDDRCEPIDFDDPTDLAAITIETYTARRSYEIAAEYRKRGVPVVMGGFHATLLPDEVEHHCDAMLLGDAENIWEQIVEDARHGRLQRRYQAQPGVPQLKRTLPRRDLFKGKGYLPVTLMQFSRGCRFACDFCAISVFFEKKHYIRTHEEVLRELEAQERKLVFFVDDNFLSNQEAAKSFLRALIPAKIRWVSQASIDMTTDPELMDLLAESGCLGNVIGFESINVDNVKMMKKAPNLIGEKVKDWDYYHRRCEVLREYGLQTWAAFTLGHDHDTWDSIMATHQFAMENKFCFAAYNILMPYPNTPLYERLDREGRLLFDRKWWLHPEYRFNHASFVPKNLEPDELTEACWRIRNDWNRPMTLLKRMWDFKTHMSSLARFMVYWRYNPIYSRATYDKQGMWFGYDGTSIRPTDARAQGEASGGVRLGAK